MTHGAVAPADDRFQLEAIIADLSIGVMTLSADGSLAYANQYALDMHGVHTLGELGSSAAGYRKKFRLTDLLEVPLPASAYPFERLLAGDTFDAVMLKLPFKDDWRVHKCRGISVKDRAGDTDFYVLVCEDETERFDAEQRFERTFTANPAPGLINRLSDLRYIKVNRGFLEMTGFRREDIIGRTAYEFDVLAGVESRELAVKRFHDGKQFPPLESYLATESGGQKFVLVGGQPLEVGSEACMLLTFVDLDDRKKAENALRQSEERFERAFTAAPAASVISRLGDGRIYNVNDAFKTLTGYSASEAIGRTTAELSLWKSEGEKVIGSLLGTQRSFQNLELKLHTKSGEFIDIVAAAETIRIGDEPCLMLMFHDISDWKRSEAELIEAINLVMKEPDWFSSSVAKKLMSVRGKQPSPQTEAKLARLSTREQQVMELICRGVDGAGIGQELGIAANTVRNYTSGLYKKLDLHSRAEVIVWAKRHELIH